MKSIIALALILGAFTVHALDAKAVSNNSQEISAKAKKVRTNQRHVIAMSVKVVVMRRILVRKLTKEMIAMKADHSTAEDTLAVVMVAGS